LFRARLNGVLSKLKVNVNALKTVKPHIEVDLKEINEDSLTWLQRMEPSGPENELPLFYTREVTLYGRPKIVGGSHLKFGISQGSLNFAAIGFGLSNYSHSLIESSIFNIAYYPEWNIFRGVRSIQLRVIALDFA